MPPTRVLRVLLDSNVVLDLMLRRETWLTQAQPLVEAADAGLVIGHIPASAMTDLFSISRRLVGTDRAFDVIDRCLEDFDQLSVDRAVIEAARRRPGSDFEDNVKIACAHEARLDLIITRNVGDFRDSPVPAIEPAAIVGYLAP